MERLILERMIPGTRERGASPAGGREDRPGERAPAGRLEPCLRCGAPLRPRGSGCKADPCPNCAHPYPHGDCSD